MWVLFYGHADQAPGPDAVQTRVAPAPEGCGGVAAAEVGEEGRGGGEGTREKADEDGDLDPRRRKRARGRGDK